MKNSLGKKTPVIGLIFLLGFVSCVNEITDTSNVTKPGLSGVFNYETQNNCNLNLTFRDSQNNPLVNTGLEFYDKNPLNTGSSVWRSDIIKFASAQTDENGRFSTMFSLSSIVDTVYIKINSIDFPLPVMVAINSGSVSQTISSGATSPLKSASASVSPWKYEVSPFNSGSNLWSLGNFSNIGYPDYIESREAVNYNMKYSINTALPEKKNQIKTNPDLFTNPNSGNLKTQDKCQIWVTFLAEGAWWQNTLGYFYYPTNNAPASVAAITKQVVVFPNASTPYGFQSGDSGNGNMVQGDKVRLNYYNEETKQWTDTFPAGLTISWVLYPAGFRNGMGGNKGIIPTWNPIYSIASFNTNKQQQNVLLYDKVTENFIIGFEDTEREVISPSSDLDFNDVLIYATANPVSAIDKRDLKVLTPVIPTDTDGDGVNDDTDEFPRDPLRAFTQYYPTTGTGTLAFEDNWPKKGDYDFNDLVVGYRYQLVTNAAGNIKDVHASYSVEAVGAKYRNGFAIQFYTSPGNIESVSGQKNIPGNTLFNINPKGYENGQTYAVIPVFPDAHKLFSNGPTDFINTLQNLPTAPAIPIQLSVTFSSAVAPETLGSVPFNPFLIIDQQRGREVHLAGQKPTSLANRTLFGTGDDRTNETTIFYKGDLEYPWALNIPATFYYPVEWARIDEVYTKLPDWVQSFGTRYTDWYSNPAYRNTDKVYKKH